MEMGVVNTNNVQKLMTLLLIEDTSSEVITEKDKRDIKQLLSCLLNNCYITDYNFFDKETSSVYGYSIDDEVTMYIQDEYDVVHFEEVTTF